MKTIQVVVALLAALALMGAADEPCPVAIAWQRGPELSQAIGGPALGRIGRDLVVAGGTFWIKEQEKVWSADAYRLGPNDDRWTAIPPLPAKAAYPCAVSFRGAVYVFGGQTADKTNTDRSWRLVHAGGEYRWEPFVPLPEKLANMQSALIGSTVYLVAGDAGEPPVPNNHVWKLDLACRRPVWTACADLPGPPRVGVAVGACHGQVYTFGGGVPDAFRYDPRADRWERIADLPWPQQWAWAATWRGRYVIIPGGSIAPEKLGEIAQGTRIDANGFSAEVLVFDAQTQKYWRSDPLPAGIIDYGLVLEGDRLFLAGGEDRGRHRQSWLMIGKLSFR